MLKWAHETCSRQHWQQKVKVYLDGLQRVVERLEQAHTFGAELQTVTHSETVRAVRLPSTKLSNSSLRRLPESMRKADQTEVSVPDTAVKSQRNTLVRKRTVAGDGDHPRELVLST